MASDYNVNTSGAFVWATGANWAATTAPVSTNLITVSNSSGAIDASNQSAVTLASLTVPMTFTGTAGTWALNVAGYLRLSSTLAYFGAAGNSGTAATGSGRWMQDFGTNATSILVYNTSSSPTDANLEPLRFLGVHASNVITVVGGRVGIATTIPGEVSTFPTVNNGGGTLDLGAGVTWTTLNNTGGTTNVLSAGTTVNAQAGTVNIGGTGALTTANAQGGTINYGSTGTLGTLHMYDGFVDLTVSPLARIVSSIVLHEGNSTLIVDSASTTVTAITVSGRIRITVSPA